MIHTEHGGSFHAVGMRMGVGEATGGSIYPILQAFTPSWDPSHLHSWKKWETGHTTSPSFVNGLNVGPQKPILTFLPRPRLPSAATVVFLTKPCRTCVELGSKCFL